MSEKASKISQEAVQVIEKVINVGLRHDVRDQEGNIRDESGNIVYHGAIDSSVVPVSMESSLEEGDRTHVSSIEAGYADYRGARPVKEVATETQYPEFTIGASANDYTTYPLKGGGIASVGRVRRSDGKGHEEVIGSVKDVDVVHVDKDGNATRNRLTGRRAERATEIIANRVARQMGGILVDAAKKDIDSVKF